MEHIKCIVVGDFSAGKTALLTTFATQKYPKDYVPTVFDNTTVELLIDKQQMNMSLWDTAGQENYENLRTLTYPQTSVILLCFSLIDENSYDNVATKWIPELVHHAPLVPILLVGTNSHLRKNPEEKCLPSKMGEELKTTFGLHKYMECSALTQDNLNEVFCEAARAAKARKKKNEKDACIIL